MLCAQAMTIGVCAAHVTNKFCGSSLEAELHENWIKHERIYNANRNNIE